MITQLEQKWLRKELVEGRGIGYAITIGDDRRELPATIIRYLRTRITIHTQDDRELTAPLSHIHRILTSHPAEPVKPPVKPTEQWVRDFNNFSRVLQRNNERNREHNSQRLASLRQEIRATQQFLKSLEAQKSFPLRTQEWFKEEITAIKKHTAVVGVWLNENGSLIIETNDLPVLRDGEPTGDDVGRLYIKIILEEENPIRIRNRDWQYDEHPHPHSEDYGDRTCFGDHRILPLLSTPYLLVDFLIRFYSEFYQGNPYEDYEDWLENHEEVNDSFEQFLGRKWRL